MRSSLLGTIGSFLGDIGRANEAVRTYERLSALSDGALAARGLKRTDLVATAYDRAFGGSR
jgi:hypothetical protein